MKIRVEQKISQADLKSPIVITGLPGIANVGKISVESLVSMTDAKKVFDVYTDDLPPQVLVSKGIHHVYKTSLYLYKSDNDEPHDLLILIGDYQPPSTTGVFEYVDYMINHFVSLGVISILSLAAYEQNFETYFERFPQEPRVYVSGSSTEFIKEVTDDSEKVIIMNEGIITGANGLFPAWANEYYNLPSLCLMGETMSIIKFDFWAARSVLSVIGNYLGIKKIDLHRFDEEVEGVKDFIKWAKTEIDKKGFGSRPRAPTDQYIG